MKRFLKILLPLVFLFAFSVPQRAHAEKINSFDVTITSHKNGLMDITEKINYDFENLERHGIYRYIPLYSRVGNLYRIVKISNVSIIRDGEKEKFQTTNSKEQVYFKIGNSDKTITGRHLYQISYTVGNGIGSNFPNYDEIYWDVTGNNWTVEIEKASIKFENDFEAKETDFKCFTGATGSTESNCLVSGSTIETSGILYSGEGLTAIVIYPKGTFPPSTLLKELPKT